MALLQSMSSLYYYKKSLPASKVTDSGSLKAFQVEVYLVRRSPLPPQLTELAVQRTAISPFHSFPLFKWKMPCFPLTINYISQ